jgi:signal transduction histidine kinase
MRRLNLLPRTLVARVFLLYSTAMLLFVGIGFSCFAIYTGQSSVEDAKEEAEAFISVITPTISESAVIGDYDTIQRNLERVVHHPALVQAVFIDLNGGRIEVSRKDVIELPAPGWLRSLIAERLPIAQAAIVVGGKDYGMLRLGIWSDEIAADVWRQALAALLLSLLSLLGGVILVWFPLKRWLGNLGRIQTFGEELQTAGGRLSHVVDENAPLEFRQTFEILNRAAASLQVERAQASVTLSAIGDGVATTNSEGVVVLANPVLGVMLGQPTAALLGRPIRELMPTLLDHMPVGQAWRGRRVQVTSADGIPRVLEASLSLIEEGPEAGATGRPAAGWVLAFRDVSEQQALEDRLRHELAARAGAMQAMRALLESSPARAAASNPSAAADDIEALSTLVAEMVMQLQRQTEQLSAIFRLSPDGFVSFDRARRVQYASETFTRLTGIEASDCLGWSEDELGEALQRHAASGAQPLRFEALRRSNFQLELNTPTSRILELSLLEAAASAVSQVLHLRDITHEFEVDRLKSEFLTAAAHELRTPMTSIYGFTELMMTRTMAPERHKELLERVYRQSAAMMVILDELLDIARIEARRGKDFVYEACELDALVSEAVQDFTPPAGREAPQLTLAGRPLTLQADRMKLQQALRNLLSNAYKYSPAGGSVWVRVLAPGEAGMARIEVQDQGIGMKPQELARVAERFYRADKSGAIPGTGLGMSIVKEIVELMGGRLEMHSEYRVGSTASLLMPVLKSEAASAAANAAPST